MRTRLWQSIAVVASSIGLLTACGLGSLGPTQPPPPPLPEIAVSTHVLRFRAEPGASDVQSFTITNVSDHIVVLRSVSISGAGAASFHETSGCNNTLAEQQQCVVSVVFVPQQQGGVEAMLVVATDSFVKSELWLVGEGQSKLR